MPEPRHLEKAPITEAVIDLRVSPRPEFKFEELEAVVERLAPEYSEKAELQVREFLLEFGQNAETVASRRQGPFGFRLATPDKNRVVQVRPNGLAYSWLKPYSSWEDLRASTLAAWRIYNDTLRPDRIVRAAVRYINLVPLPLPIEELREFLPASPDIPVEWPQMMSGYLSRIGLVDEQSGNQVVVTQTSEQGAEHGTMSFLVDIDCFNTSPPSATKEAWELLDRLRDLKNQIFFSSVTERLLEMFE